MISLEKWMILTRLQKLTKIVGDLGKLLLPNALNGCPKCKKSPNLVTLSVTNLASTWRWRLRRSIRRDDKLRPESRRQRVLQEVAGARRAVGIAAKEGTGLQVS